MALGANAEVTEERPAWHVTPAEEVAARLRTDPGLGLSPERAAELLAEVGPNRLRETRRTPRWRMFLGQFQDFMILVLGVAVVISALEGETVEAVAIMAILLLNGVLGFVQEYRAERALEALRAMSAPTAAIVRGGGERQVRAAELVPGDVVLLEAGDSVPADGRLVEAAALQVMEASLTGESMPVHKTSAPMHEAHVGIGDRVNMVYAGTSITVGRARCIVTETGQDTEMGRIADLLAGQGDERTPLQRELKVVGKRIAVLVLAVAAIVFGIGAWQALQAAGPAGFADPEFRSRLTVALLVAISLAVAAIPEGLPAIVTVSLSLGVREMARRNAIVRKLHAVETLGSTTFICSDKTGTLTKNEMSVRRLVVGLEVVEVLADWILEPEDGPPDLEDRRLLLEIGASANDARVAPEGEIVGDPTEVALMEAAHNLADVLVRPRRLAEIPFDSERKRMTTVHSTETSGMVAFMKGAPDVVLGLCSSARLHGKTVPMTEETRSRLLGLNERLASSGYRVLACAMRDLPEDLDVQASPAETETDMTYVGLMGLLDPPRPEVERAIASAHAAGIRVAMVTGDHALTAQAIGDEIGLLEGERVLTGVELERMSDDELYEAAEHVRIYARVDPEHKLRIIDALRRRGHRVAMTGDGVNDAPALKRADIGVAMGRIGTDVSREAADMVLADDNFATIVEAVRQGRAVFDNLRKFILFLLSCNASEVLIIFVTTFFARTPALLPLQILWINLVTDGLPALALGVDPASRDIMRRPPRTASESILAPRRQAQVVWQGALITLAGLSMYVYANHVMPGHAGARGQTMLFSAMVLAQLLHAFDFRSERRSVFTLNSLRNRWLVLAFLGSLSLQLVVIYAPFAHPVFSTVPLSLTDLAVVAVGALLPIALIDAVKLRQAKRL